MEQRSFTTGKDEVVVDELSDFFRPSSSFWASIATLATTPPSPQRGTTSERDYQIDLFQSGDAEGVAQLFREVYGDGYPLKIVYDRDQLVAAFQDKEYIPVVARAPDNRIVGFTSLYRPAPYKGVFEAGLSLVSPDYRNTSIYGLLARHAVRTSRTIPELEVLYFEGVCNHIIAQRAGAMFRHIETAMEIDLMSKEAYEGESAPGRVSTVDAFRTFTQKPHTVYVPEVYEECIRYIYDGFDDSRTRVPSTAGLPTGQSTDMAARLFDFARLARITVHEAGGDFEARFDAEECRMRDRNCAVIQVWLKLSHPWVGKVANLLRNRGFFLGGILPRWFGEDGLLMQKVQVQPNWEGINLYSDRAKRILEMIREDWGAVRGKQAGDLYI